MRTSPGPGTGSAAGAQFMTSGPPASRTTMAYMRLLLSPLGGVGNLGQIILGDFSYRCPRQPVEADVFPRDFVPCEVFSAVHVQLVIGYRQPWLQGDVGDDLFTPVFIVTSDDGSF